MRVKSHMTSIALIDGRKGGMRFVVSKGPCSISVIVTRGKDYSVLRSNGSFGTRLVHKRNKGDCSIGVFCHSCRISVISARAGCLHVGGNNRRERSSGVITPVPKGIIGVPIQGNSHLSSKSVIMILRTVGVRDGCGIASSYAMESVLIGRKSSIGTGRMLVMLSVVGRS